MFFDIDGTLIRGTTANLFYARLLGVEEDVLELERKLRAGIIDSDIFMVEVSKIMNCLTVNYVKENFHRVPVVEGIGETVEALKKVGISPIIVTTSDVLFATCFKEEYGFDEVYGTIHEVEEDGKVGIGKSVCSSQHKILHVTNTVHKLGGTMDNVFAVGDSFTDIPLFEKVGCSIAFNYDETLQGKADLYIRSNRIDSILEGIVQYVKQHVQP